MRGTILNKFPTCSESVELVADSLLDDPHCVPCNTFGEQREIYEWIRLFREALFLRQGGAYFWSGGRSFHFRGALFGP